MKRILLGLMIAGAGLVFASTPALAQRPYYHGPAFRASVGVGPYYYGAYRPYYYGPAFYPPPRPVYPVYPYPVYAAPVVAPAPVVVPPPVYGPSFSFSFGR